VSEAALRARLGRPPRWTPTAALVGDVDGGPVRTAGWSVRGRLAASPFTGGRLEDAVGYLDAGELLDDARVDAAVVDGEVPDLAALLPSLRRAGLVVLLAGPAPLDVDVVQAAQAVDGPPSGVALARRWEPWARTVRAALPLAGAPPLQVTVRGWPRGEAAAAELVDLAGLWCGEVLGGVAAPGPLPADRLPGGEPVSWSLLTGSGATVLVSHEGPGPLVRVSFPSARLEAGPAGAGWEGGAALPLLALPEWVPPVPLGTSPGLVATAAALLEAVGGGDVRPHRGQPADPPPADLGDLLVAARVLAALRESSRTERPVPVS
jgi:hypothetical protein